MADANTIINDPNYVPLASEDGVPLATEDDTFIITSSTLSSRPTDGRFGKIKTWLKAPFRRVRKKK